MSTNFFLSPLPPLSNTSHFAFNYNSISDSYVPILFFLKSPKPIRFSRPPKSKSNSTTSSTSSSTQHITSTSTSITTAGDHKNNEDISVKSTNPDYSFSSERFSSHAGAAVRMPMAPWMKGPLLLEPNQVLGLSKSRKKKDSTNGKFKNPDRSLTHKVSGGRGKKAMKKIFESIGKLQEAQHSEVAQRNPGEIEFDFSLGEFGGEGNSKIGGKMPWEMEERIVFRRPKKEKVVTAAELSLDGVLLERLRGEAAKMRRWVKVKKAGVTQAVVDQIHLIWKNNELAMLKFDLPLCRNMDRAREIVEIKTGGLVVWSKKDALVIYRGGNYQLRLKTFSMMNHGLTGAQETSSLNFSYKDNVTVSQVTSNESTVDEMMSRKDGEEVTILMNASLYEREADRLLDGLGPRFVDWWRPKPLPVDADLLPEVVPGFEPPFRLCPPHTRSKLTDDELTYLRKRAHPLPTHFVLGRNRKLQGLAAAILKLWEKCHIAKIAVKWGILNTNNEQMANELKEGVGSLMV